MRPAGGPRLGDRGGGANTRFSGTEVAGSSFSQPAGIPQRATNPVPLARLNQVEFQYRLHYASMVPDMMPLIVKAQAVTPKQGVQGRRKCLEPFPLSAAPSPPYCIAC